MLMHESSVKVLTAVKKEVIRGESQLANIRKRRTTLFLDSEDDETPAHPTRKRQRALESSSSSSELTRVQHPPTDKLLSPARPEPDACHSKKRP